MPNNGSVLSDEASEYPPWIELCHMSASGSVNFDGWWLSDALHDRRRWPLPPVELTGLECLVVLPIATSIKGSYTRASSFRRRGVSSYSPTRVA
jgi:hypothetical protein